MLRRAACRKWRLSDELFTHNSVCGLFGRAAPADAMRVLGYKGIETRLLDGDLVQFVVTMDGEAMPDDVRRYTECAAAQYSLIRGYGFARHLRTNVEIKGGQWRGDAVYTISAALPRGLKTIDAEVIVHNCIEDKIPMV